jgi:hypothetical protein
LGMSEVVSEDAVRRGLDKIDEHDGLAWLQGHLDYTTRPLLSEIGGVSARRSCSRWRSRPSKARFSSNAILQV